METKSSPLVSIGMPAYNGEMFIRQALDSLLAQDFKDFELIISDNASTDKTAEICKEYSKRDSRIKYHRNDKNIGPTANFDSLIYLAKGKYFMWAADDDLWEPQFISQMLDALKSNLCAVISFCRFDIVDVNGKLICGKEKYYEKMAKQLENRNAFKRMLPMCYVKLYGMSMATYIYGLMRKDVLVKCGGFEKKVDVHMGADIATLFNLLSYGPFLNVNKVLFHRRDNIPRMSARPKIGEIIKKERFLSIALKWLKKVNGHYGALRKVVRASSTNMLEKLILIIILTAAELRHYLHVICHTLAAHT